jgi:c-di-GMP-related signal transduction protein
VTLKSKSPDQIALPVSVYGRDYAVARQPILTLKERVFGYELLFRDGVKNCFPASMDQTDAARYVLDRSFLEGFDVLCDGRLAFVNCTREVLLAEFITLLPPDRTVVEVLETVPPDKEVVASCRKLKDAGYLIALDDFVPDDPRESLVALADIVKLDIRMNSPAEMAAMEKLYRKSGCRFLAEKVETLEEFEVTRDIGCVYFQGYFFRKPEIQRSRQIPANHLNYIRLLQSVSRVVIDPREIESILKCEPSLCYSLLRYLNSATFGFSSGIRSVRHALSLLGENDTRRWMRLVALLAAGQNKPSDLILSALVRARFCELIGPYVQQPEPDLFMMGLMSLVDAILEIPMSFVLENITLTPEIQATLLGNTSSLSPVFRLMLAQESGDWERVGELAKAMGLIEKDVEQRYWEAMRWARQMTHGE